MLPGAPAPAQPVRPTQDPDDYDEDDESPVHDEFDEFDELNRSTATSTFLDSPWWRRAGIAVATFIVLAFMLPLLVPIFSGGNGHDGGDAQSPTNNVPDFLLPAASGGNFRLSDEIREHDAVVLVFYRGYF